MTSPTLHSAPALAHQFVGDDYQPLSAPADTARQKKPDTMGSRLVELLRREWLTPLDALKAVGCLSLSQRVGELKRAGLAVEDRWVDLDGGKRVKAYRITA